MFAFEVKDMTCGHCVSTITKAVKAEDKDATIHVDLASHRVEIESTSEAKAIMEVITEAGFTPIAL